MCEWVFFQFCYGMFLCTCNLKVEGVGRSLCEIYYYGLLFFLIYLNFYQATRLVTLFTLLLQVKRKLPKVNRRLANQILEEEEAETEKKDEEVNKIKKASKKKKGFNTEIFQDDRFANMFKNEVWLDCQTLLVIFFSTFLLVIWNLSWNSFKKKIWGKNRKEKKNKFKASLQDVLSKDQITYASIYSWNRDVS